MLFIHIDQDFHVVQHLLLLYLKILLHFLVIYIISNRRSANICIFVPLTVTYPFSLLPVSLLLVLSNLIMMNFDIVLFMTWDFFVSLGCCFIVFINFWKYSAITSSNAFCSLPLQELLVTHAVLQHADDAFPRFSSCVSFVQFLLLWFYFHLPFPLHCLICHSFHLAYFRVKHYSFSLWKFGLYLLFIFCMYIINIYTSSSSFLNICNIVLITNVLIYSFYNLYHFWGGFE